MLECVSYINSGIDISVNHPWHVNSEIMLVSLLNFNFSILILLENYTCHTTRLRFKLYDSYSTLYPSYFNWELWTRIVHISVTAVQTLKWSIKIETILKQQLSDDESKIGDSVNNV